MSAEPQYATQRDLSRDTLGPEVAAVMRKLSFEPMPWQRDVLDVAYEIDDNGELVYREVIEIVPRQAGKTAKVLGQQVHRAVNMARRLGRPQNSFYTAQTGGHARTKFIDEHMPILDGSPYHGHYDLRLRTGAESLKWSNGSIHRIGPPMAKSGHGASQDLVQLDEAFILRDNLLEQGVKPTMVTRQSPQLWIVSAAGTMDSSYLRQKLEMGRELVRHGVQDGVAYFEWSADGLDLDPADPRTWALVHPAIGHTITTKALEADFRSMDIVEFARAYLAIWPTRTKPRVVSEEDWAKCCDVESRPLDPVCFAIDVSPIRSSAAVSVAGKRHDGGYHVEVVRHEAGTGWVGPYVRKLLDKAPGSTVCLDSGASASTLLPELERLKVPVRLLTTSDVARSSGVFLDTVNRGSLRHIDQTSLNVALAGATTRRIGDKLAWARSDSSVDITPLVSCTLALWALETTPPPKKFRMGLIR